MQRLCPTGHVMLVMNSFELSALFRAWRYESKSSKKSLGCMFAACSRALDGRIRKLIISCQDLFLCVEPYTQVAPQLPVTGVGGVSHHALHLSHLSPFTATAMWNSYYQGRPSATHFIQGGSGWHV